MWFGVLLRWLFGLIGGLVGLLFGVGRLGIMVDLVY